MWQIDASIAADEAITRNEELHNRYIIAVQLQHLIPVICGGLIFVLNVHGDLIIGEKD